MRTFLLRSFGLAGLALAAPMCLAHAQSVSTFTNPLCGVVNFRFCDQAPASGAAMPPPPDTADVPPPEAGGAPRAKKVAAVTKARPKTKPRKAKAAVPAEAAPTPDE